MSIDALISAYGRTLARQRPVWIRDVSGGAAVSTTAGTTTAAISGYLQIGAGAVALRYGRENVRHSATLYCLGSVDIKPDDLLTVTIASEIRTYRVDTVRIPDDRPNSDPLCHKICGLEEDYPRG
jgi:hypothetical protein